MQDFTISFWLLAIGLIAVSAKPTYINPRSGYLVKANAAIEPRAIKLV